MARDAKLELELKMPKSIKLQHISKLKSLTLNSFDSAEYG